MGNQDESLENGEKQGCSNELKRKEQSKVKAFKANVNERYVVKIGEQGKKKKSKKRKNKNMKNKTKPSEAD